LIGVIITPVFFNVYSSRVFEPDKLTSLRSLAVVMAILWIVRLLDELLQGEQPLRFTLKTPMVLPALVTMVVYLLSSFFSLVPYTSFVGSYQRLQGTFTLFGYLTLFFALITTMHTRAQIHRLMTVLILSSLPVALYGIIQHNGLDPLPWAGDVQTRVASNMGNAIFVAAYLIMIVPLVIFRIIKSFQDILEREEARISDILRASSYIFILAVQLLTIWYSRSRGPWLGTVTLAFLFLFLALLLLQRKAIDADEGTAPWYLDVLRGLGFGLGTTALLGLLIGLGWLALPGQVGLYVGGGLAALVFGGIWLYRIVERKGWRWLWIGWFTIGLIASLALLSINVVEPLNRWARKTQLSRMARILEWERGTGKVRILIWKGALDMISIHEPIEYPDGRKDTWNWLRPLIGYGPESMYVGYNNFYPPELGHYESRTASPDRSHNETLDSLVITGVLGLAAYLFTFGSIFYWGLRWLGFLENRRQFWIYVGLMALITLALFVLFLALGHLYFFAVAIPLGFVIGTGLYLTWQGLRATLGNVDKADALSANAMHPHALLISAILAAILGHFVEINFGIAIAATRTVFWTLAGVLVVLGKQWLPEFEETEAPEPRRKRRGSHRRAQHTAHGNRWVWSVLGLSLTAVFLLGTLAFDFITNPDRLTNGGQVFWRSLTVLYSKNRTSYGALMIFLFTWLLFGVVGLGEFDREGLFAGDRKGGLAILIYSGVSLIGLLLFGSSLSAFHARLPLIQVQTIEDVVDVAVTLSGVLGHYYGLIFVTLVVLAITLTGEVKNTPKPWAEPVSLVVLPILLLSGIFLIRDYSYDLIRADIIFKQGSSFANSQDPQQKQIGIAHYEKAIELAPREDYYRLFQGKAYLELAQSLPADTDPAQRERLFEITEEVLQEAREINPLNTDHSANLARFYRSWGASVSDPERREELLLKSRENYSKALTLSPNNAILWNELAILNAFDLQDEIAFQEAIFHSLKLDAEFDQTWMTLGDVRANVLNDTAGAIEAYQKAIELSPKNCRVRHTLGSLQIQENRWEAAVESLEPIFEHCPNASYLWDVYRLLAVSFYYQGQQQQALQLANEALRLAPEEQQDVIEQLIAAIQQSAVEP